MADGRLISHFFFTLTVDRCSVLPCTRKIVESHEYKERKKERERESLRNPIYPQDYPILFIQSISNAVRSTVTDCGKGHARSGRGKRERERLKDRGLLGIEGLAVGIRGTGWLHAILRIDGERFYSISSETLSTYTSRIA